MKVLITGATGFIGTAVLARIAHLDRYETIYLLLRSSSVGSLEERMSALLSRIFPREVALRVRGKFKVISGDLTTANLGLCERDEQELVDELDQILHLAADTNFESSLKESRLINVEGTRQVLNLAMRCYRRGRLRRFDHVSTAFVAGTRRGVVREDDLERGQKFATHYEQTKYEAELLVREFQAELPIAVHRPSIVVGDSASGFTPNFNVLYWPLKFLSKGILPCVPCRRAARLDVVPVDYVADCLVALIADSRALNKTFHLTAGRGNELRIKQLVRDVFALTSVRRRPFVPFWVLYLVWKTPLARLISANVFEMALLGQRYVTYYRGTGVRFCAQKTLELLSRYQLEPPAWDSYKDRILTYCEVSHWGRRPPLPTHYYLSQSITVGQQPGAIYDDSTA